VTGAQAWLEWAPTRRGEALSAWADAIEADRTRLAALESSPVGRPRAEAEAEVVTAAGRCRFWAGLADKVSGSQPPSAPNLLTYVRRVPVGVVGVAPSWRGPTFGLVDAASAALACGNAVEVTPSGYSPLSALRVVELALEAGLPGGLVDVAPLSPSAVFTMRTGGASIAVVFADADLDAAADEAVNGVFVNAGGFLTGATRVLVERPVAADFAERLVERLGPVRSGGPADPGTTLGPLPTRALAERYRAYCAEAARDAHVVGGVEDAGGRFVAPAVVTGVEWGSPLAGREVSGPALAVLAFDTEGQAWKVADEPAFAAGATVWTGDLGRLFRVVDRLRATTVLGNAVRRLGPVPLFGGRTEIEALTRCRQVGIDRAVR
jgi:acyl-CoA reductase-like NAD-dependent aldehyde dehydrogenase